MFGCRSSTLAQRTLPEPSILLAAPANGTIRVWRVLGRGSLSLRVLRPAGEQLIGAGRSAEATNVTGGPNVTDLPIRAGDVIGVDLLGEPVSELGDFVYTGATSSDFYPEALPEDGIARTPTPSPNFEIMLNAEVILTPTISGIAPASGAVAGGDVVTISGTNLDGVTAVMFGSTSASRFTLDSPTQITAVAPPAPAGTVAVGAVSPGGASAPVEADRYTYLAPPTLVAPMPTGPVLSAVGESANRWRSGMALSTISHGVPVGTTFAFALNEDATVSLRFTQRVTGRRVDGKCLAYSKHDSGKSRCQRTLPAGMLSVAAHAGANKIRFTGRLSSQKRLEPGRYAVSIMAQDAAGLHSVPELLSFTVVR